jgi:UDP-N-acetylglucosamine acyltransferase
MISAHAIVDPKAQIAPDVEIGPVEIGPFCIIGANVRIESGCRLLSNVVVSGHTTIGRDNIFHPYCVIGGSPQDRKYKGSPTRLEIGNHNIFRESVTINLGTERGGGITRVGNNNMLMVNVHLGHDVQFGSNCTLANNVMLAGHVIVEDNVNMAGGVGIHQFVTVGRLSFLGGYARIHHDAPPYCKIDGADEMRGLNVKALGPAGFTDPDIEALEGAYKRLFARDCGIPLADVLSQFDTMNGINPHVRYMVEFLRNRTMGRHGRYLQALFLARRNKK